MFVKEGAVISMLAEAVEQTEDAYGKDLEVRIYGTPDGDFELYEDDGKTFAYDKGNYRIRKLVVKNGVLSEIVVKDDAPAMFGKTTLKMMTK